MPTFYPTSGGLDAYRAYRNAVAQIPGHVVTMPGGSLTFQYDQPVAPFQFPDPSSPLYSQFFNEFTRYDPSHGIDLVDVPLDQLAARAGYRQPASATPTALIEAAQDRATRAQQAGLRDAALAIGAAFGGMALSGGLGGTAAGAAGSGSGALTGVTLPASAVPIGAGTSLDALVGGGLASFDFPAAISGLGGAAGAGAGGGGLWSQIRNALTGGGSTMPSSSGGVLSGIGGLQGLGALLGGASGLIGSLTAPDSQTVTQQTQLPPSVQQALDFIINQSMSLQNTGSLVPPLSGLTQQGIGALSAPLSGPGFGALSGFASGTFSNPFLGSNDLTGVTDFITNAAQRAVGDQFSMAGRSGSPAQAITLGKTVAQQLAPFAFNARESQLGRQFTAGENSLDRQLSSALPLLNFQRQSALDMLTGGSILDQQARQLALEPFTRLNLLTGPLVSAISGAPTSSSTTTPLYNNPLLSGLGGALTGAQLGGLFGG